VVEGGTLQNSEDDHSNYATIFYEGVAFLATPNYTGYAVNANGGFAMIGCSVRGFRVGVKTQETNEKFLICGTVFEGCELAIEAHQQAAEILGCSFVGNKTNAIVSTNGQSNGLVATFVVVRSDDVYFLVAPERISTLCSSSRLLTATRGPCTTLL
jgi:hypothetical protein